MIGTLKMIFIPSLIISLCYKRSAYLEIEIDIFFVTASSFHVMELNDCGTYCMGLELPHPSPNN